MRLEAHLDGATHAIEIDEREGRFRFSVDGRVYEGDVFRPEPGTIAFRLGSRVIEARVGQLAGSDALRVQMGSSFADVVVVDRRRRALSSESTDHGRLTLIAPMPGKVVAVLASAGTTVSRGQGVFVVEAMKMQNEVKAPRDGVVVDVRVSTGETVNAGQILASIE